MLAEPWRVQFLGGICARQRGRSITRFRTYRAGALFAYLVYHARVPHPRETLIAMLWPECTPDAGRNSLSTELSSLRHQLEPPGTATGTILRADRATLQINPEAMTTDVAEFESALKAAVQTTSDLERVALLSRAAEPPARTADDEPAQTDEMARKS